MRKFFRNSTEVFFWNIISICTSKIMAKISKEMRMKTVNMTKNMSQLRNSEFQKVKAQISPWSFKALQVFWIDLKSYYGVKRRSRASCVTVFIWLHSEVILFFTPCWLVDVIPWTRKAQKELYERRQQQIGDKDFFFFSFFLLFPGFNNHSMGEGIFLEYNWNGWIPQSRCLKIR